jgi:hypothetical protein
MKKTYPLIALAVFSMALRTCIALSIDSVPIVDFARFYDTARHIAVGDWDFNRTSYFTIWAYQTGFALYEAIVIRLTGEEYAKTALIILNCLYITGTNVFVYLIAGKITSSRRCALFAGLLYLLIPELYTLAPVLTNQHLALFLLMSGFYLALNGGSRAIAAAGVLFALGNCIRPLGVIALAAVLLYVLLNCVVQKSKPLPAVKSCVILLAAYFLLSGAANAVVIGSGLNPKGLSNNDPLWKFAAGLDYEHTGGWSRELTDAVYAIDDSELRTAAELDWIAQHKPQNIQQWATLFAEKIRTLWFDNPDLQWSFTDLPTWSETFYAVNVRVNIALWIMAIISTTIIWRRYNAQAILPCAALLLYFGAHLLIEVQPRYRDFALPLLCILSSAVVRFTIDN